MKLSTITQAAVMVVVTVFVNSLCHRSAVAQSAEPKAEIVAFQIAKANKNDKFGGSAIGGMMPGTRVYVRVAMKDMSIISIDESSVPIISDDQGNQLSKESARGMGLRFMSRFAEDKKSVTVPINGKGFPAKGSKALHVKGTLKLNCASTTKEEKVEGELKVNGEFKLAGIETKIQRMGKGFEDNSTQISFRASQNFDSIQTITAINKAGKELEGSSRGTSSFGFRNKKTYERTYEFEANQDEIVGFKVVYYNDIKVVEVPIDLKFGFDF